MMTSRFCGFMTHILFKPWGVRIRRFCLVLPPQRRCTPPGAAALVSRYEADREGFWLHRVSPTEGSTNYHTSEVIREV
ncbi:MAG: hypothetical protein O7G88_15290 [bacterium]|nr:hypothetical protein [bacterium]